MRKFLTALFLGVLFVILNVFYVIIPTLDDIRNTLTLYLLNRNLPKDSYTTTDKDIENLPNASSFFKVTYDYSTEGSKPGSVFGSISNADNSKGKYDNFYYLDFRLFLDSLFHGKPETKAWSNWDRETYYVQAYVLKTNSVPNTMDLYITYPPDKNFSNVWKEVKLNCDERNSVLVSNMNFDLISSGINIFDVAKKDDRFFAYCLDETCSTVGRSCILVQQKDINEKP